MTKKEAALLYASWGWKVLPVLENSKIPATAHGIKDATSDTQAIVKWWEKNPEYNIGIAAGEASGIIVFDIDPRNGGEESWEIWQYVNGQVPDGAIQLTAGGGFHYLSLYNKELRSCKLADGVDLLSDGRYFVAYPSTIEGRAYQWEGSSDPFDGIAPFAIPEVWIKAYHSIRKQASTTPTGGLIRGNRNSGLASLGGAMRRHGMSEAEIFAALHVANETRCEIPLPASELAQIVRSVIRYEPDGDTAAELALGAEAAEAILAADRASEHAGYYFTRATSFLSQPSPISWVIKGWIPDNALCMLYGESGSGKTFVSLDMACSVSASIEWQGVRTKSGPVVYMAGEGNYGIRQRIAAWCKRHNISRLDNLLVSNTAIDLDGSAAAAQVLGAIYELLGPEANAALVVIDTLHNHMDGDENSAQDTRKILNTCHMIRSALNTSILLVHHVGHGAESKKRIRGSSALKASVDSAILVSRDEDNVLEISNTKAKDAEMSAPLCGVLEQVPLGWYDDEGEEQIGACFVLDDKAKANNNPMPAGARYALKTLLAAIESHGKDGKTTVGDWRSEFYRGHAMSSSEAKKKAFQRARKDLVGCGGVAEQDDLFWIVEGAEVVWSDWWTEVTAGKLA